MDKTAEEGVSQQKTSGSADHEHARDDSASTPYSDEHKDHNVTRLDDHEHLDKPSHEKDLEGKIELPAAGSDLVAKEVRKT